MDSDFFNTYSLTACRIDCETRYLVENCNCRMVHMPGMHCQTQTTSCQLLWLFNTNPCSCVHTVLTQGTFKSRPSDVLTAKSTLACSQSLLNLAISAGNKIVTVLCGQLNYARSSQTSLCPFSPCSSGHTDAYITSQSRTGSCGNGT